MKKAAGNAIQGAERAAALTSSLLAFSRRQALNPKPIDANSLIAGMSDLLRRSLGERITVETVVSGGLWRTLVDPNQLENALLNLAVNARDAMPGGGKLTIETANAHLDAHYATDHEEVSAGQYVAIYITDTGTGMNKKIIDQVFEPFFTTKEVGKGTGLGLSQVYGFVKQSGGHVKIYSEVGEGTTVKIYLPRLLAEEAAAELPAKPAEAVAGGHSEIILVVEDEPGVRDHTVETLKELGYRVLEAADGPAALAIIDKQPDIDLLFTDVGLPGGMNGRQLADEAQRRRPTLKVVFTTAYARNAIIHEGRLDPGVHLVTKPFTVAEVATTLRTVLGERGAPCILLVEDEFLVRIDAAEALAEFGFQVVEAASAGTAMAMQRELGNRLGASVIDLGLPDRRGDGLAADLRAMHPRLPILIASGFIDADLRQRFAGDPHMSFVEKPYQTAQLRAALEAAGLRMPAER
jgi:CheY-like chemotaxis protein